jgi:methylated-DNA-[protein]-cysteine S-methyltransferase
MPEGDQRAALIADVAGYFAGARARFETDTDTSAYTPFQRDVWGAASAIPYGEVRSYGWVAEKVGRPRGARAVGAALGRNPIPIVIPCHRVVGANGALTGFAYGLRWKAGLLALERMGAAGGQTG